LHDNIEAFDNGAVFVYFLNPVTALWELDANSPLRARNRNKWWKELGCDDMGHDGRSERTRRYAGDRVGSAKVRYTLRNDA
jgi:hypothetical protein